MGESRMKTLAKGHKNSKIASIICISVTLAVCIALVIAFFFLTTNLSELIAFIFIFSICFFTLVGLVVIRILQKMRKDEIVIFDELQNRFVVNCYKKTINIYVHKIKEVKCNAKGPVSFIPEIFATENDYGKIIFILSDGSKIKTPLVDDAKECIKEISVLLTNR